MNVHMTKGVEISHKANFGNNSHCSKYGMHLFSTPTELYTVNL